MNLSLTWYVRSTIVCFAVLMITGAQAQVPDYDPFLTEREKDSLATAEYPYIFPLFGKDVVRKGFELPLPVGININYYQHSMDVVIEELLLGLGESEQMPLGFVEFEKVTNKARTVNARLDLWLLPFLNIYGMFGHAEADASVILTAPFPFETDVSFTGWGYGGGIILAFGIGDFWVTANGNIVWSDMDAYDEPVRANVYSFRLGRTLHIMKNRDFQVWLGAMYQDVDADVSGRLLLADVIPEELAGYFENYQDQQWYQDLNPIEKAFIDAFVQRLAQGLEGAEFTYTVTQNPEQKWSMLAGAQFELGKRWYLETEVGFLGSRTSLMMNLNYRLPI